MRNIQARFKKLKDRNNIFSDYINFALAIKYQKFSKTAIAKNFNKLVDKNDYAKSDKKAIIEHLIYLTNLTEEI